MTPALRKLALTAHITLSVGWIGAVATFLLLSIVGLLSQDAQTVRGAYLAMNLVGLSIIVPLSFASLTTGLIQALGTQWGLLRHYWVIIKFILVVLATALLLLHQFSAVEVAAKHVLATAAGTLPSAGRLGIQLVVDASLAMVALLTAITLAVYKPKGITSYGRRKIGTKTAGSGPTLGLKMLVAVLAAIVVVFIAVHLTGLAGHNLQSHSAS